MFVSTVWFPGLDDIYIYIYIFKSKHFFPMFVRTIKFNNNQSCNLVINSVIVDIKHALALQKLVCNGMSDHPMRILQSLSKPASA